jgi:hypothetical protein
VDLVADGGLEDAMETDGSQHSLGEEHPRYDLRLRFFLAYNGPAASAEFLAIVSHKTDILVEKNEFFPQISI